jgi:hypothetical protein
MKENGPNRPSTERVDTKISLAKKIMLVLISLIMTAGNGYAQSWQWAKNGGDSSTATCTTIDVDGNVYVAGSFEQTLNLDTVTLNASHSKNIFIAKFTATGSCLWAKEYGADNDIEITDIATDPYGSLYVTGNFSDSIFLKDTAVAGNGGLDFFIAKMNSSGESIWLHTAGTPYEDVSNAIVYNQKNNKVYISGQFAYPTFSPPPTNVTIQIDTISLTSIQYGDVFVACFDIAGNISWAKRYGGTGEEEAQGLSIDTLGNLYLSGYYDANTSFDGVPLAYINNGFVLGSFFIVKLDSAGAGLWGHSIGGIHQGGVSSANAFGSIKIETDKTGNCYVYGSYFGCKLKFDNSSLILNNFNEQADYCLVKYNSIGSLLWAKNSGWPSTFIYPSRLKLDDDSQVLYLTGSFNYLAYFAGDSVMSQGNQDIYLLKYDSSGNEMWILTAGDGGRDEGSDICIDTSNSIYLVGPYNSSTIVFGPNVLQNSSNKEDMFLAKISQYPTGLPNLLSLKEETRLYPNPNTGSFLLDYGDKHYEKLSITDISGREIYHEQIGAATKQQINLNLFDGVYFIRLTGEDQSAVQKFIVQH